MLISPSLLNENDACQLLGKKNDYIELLASKLSQSTQEL
jgi:hypothetical protein